MKQLVASFLVVLLIAVASCSKTKNAIVVKDCSGTYLQIDGTDYRVCNLEKVTDFQDGAKVSVSFKKISSCSGSANDQIVCMMLHPYESWIEVKKIK